MKIQNGDVYRWRAESFTKYYFVEHDLASVDETLQGLHWCRIYNEEKNARGVTGYRTILSADYFRDLSTAVGKSLSKIEKKNDIADLAKRFMHLPTPIRHH